MIKLSLQNRQAQNIRGAWDTRETRSTGVYRSPRPLRAHLKMRKKRLFYKLDSTNLWDPLAAQTTQPDQHWIIKLISGCWHVRRGGDWFLQANKINSRGLPQREGIVTRGWRVGKSADISAKYFLNQASVVSKKFTPHPSHSNPREHPSGLTK